MARILVIDDDVAIAELIKVNLDLLGHQVSTANDGMKGLALAQQNRPDLIVLDVMMPDLDGFTVCQRLRQNSATAGMLPKIVDEVDFAKVRVGYDPVVNMIIQHYGVIGVFEFNFVNHDRDCFQTT